MFEIALPATDLDLISLIKAIPDAQMRRGIRMPAWYLLLVAALGILSRCQRLPDLERFAIGHHSLLSEAVDIELRRLPSDSVATSSARWTWRLSALRFRTGRSPRSPVVQRISISW